YRRVAVRGRRGPIQATEQRIHRVRVQVDSHGGPGVAVVAEKAELGDVLPADLLIVVLVFADVLDAIARQHGADEQIDDALAEPVAQPLFRDGGRRDL